MKNKVSNIKNKLNHLYSKFFLFNWTNKMDDKQLAAVVKAKNLGFISPTTALYMYPKDRLARKFDIKFPIKFNLLSFSNTVAILV